ncbi:branched-chain amino acid ABC transporter permease [Comamonas badia]|uniref:branched-chain amino acid ABC transporter permease n=1 Tax=Comamonas badia TaxID=265291 RepID=UPI0004A3DBB8|nr:branched-chain amino acid ABC transporter permease [Comamonas badia]
MRLLSASSADALALAPAWRAPLITVLLALLARWWLPDQLGLLSHIVIMALLVISLDLVVGIAGLATLGHGALFGVGAYAAGIFASRVSGDPLLGLGVALVVGAVFALITGLFLLRYQGFTFLMLTVAVVQITANLAQKARAWTGGDDGLNSYTMNPLLGHFEFDLDGRVGSLYVIAVLGIGYWLAKRVLQSPFGLAVRGIHENRARMAALGTPVFKRLLGMYVFAGALAGVAGALSAQTNGIVALDSLSFALSAEILVMLILGGTGTLNGAVIGAVIFTLLHHTAASINPYHWLFVIGTALMLVVILPPHKWGGLLARLRSGRAA